MILTRHFVFVHVPRTGGTFVRQLFLRAAPADWEVEILEGHPTVRDIPPEKRSLPRLAVVRNPFDWYVSWFHYMLQIGGNPLYAEASEGGRKDFKGTLLSLFQLPARRFFPLDDTGSEPSVSFSWYLRFLLDGDLGPVFLARFEELREELARGFGALVSLPDAFRCELSTAAPANVSARGSYRTYYDRELVEAVGQNDGWLIDSFGYRF